MNTPQGLVFNILILIILSFCMGYLVGGPATGKKIVAWELKQLKRFVRFILKFTFRTIGNLCHWVHRQI